MNSEAIAIVEDNRVCDCILLTSMDVWSSTKKMHMYRQVLALGTCLLLCIWILVGISGRETVDKVHICCISVCSGSTCGGCVTAWCDVGWHYAAYLHAYSIQGNSRSKLRQRLESRTLPTYLHVPRCIWVGRNVRYCLCGKKAWITESLIHNHTCTLRTYLQFRFDTCKCRKVRALSCLIGKLLQGNLEL